jgi:hypothetical protein
MLLENGLKPAFGLYLFVEDGVQFSKYRTYSRG